MSFSVCVKLALLLTLLTGSALGQERKLCFSLAALQHIFDELNALSRACRKPVWPPVTPTYHVSLVTHRLSLALRAVVIPNRRWTNWRQEWMEKLKQKYHGETPKGSWLRQVVTMQRSLGSKVTGKHEYDYYPPVVNVTRLVEMTQSGRPLPIAPTDDPNVHTVRMPHTCSRLDHGKYDIIIVVYSCVKCTKVRHLARKTFLKPNLWKPLNVGYFFVMGMPALVNRRILTFQDIRIRQAPSYSRGVSRAKATKDLLAEADKYKDILIGDYMDEFFNSTLRTIVAFRWASLFCSQRTSLFLFLDPHYTVIPYQVKNFFKQIPKASIPKYYGGRVFYGSRVLRASRGKITGNRWAVSCEELPWKKYPRYASRIALFAGSQAVRDATLAMMYTRRFRIADVYTGIVFNRIHRKPRNIRQLILSTNHKSAKWAFGAFTSKIIERVNWNTGKAK